MPDGEKAFQRALAKITADNAMCRCAEVYIGGKPTGSKNWDPDCPVHPWDERLQAQADRAVEMQRRARIARLASRLVQLAERIEADNATYSAGLITEDLRDAASILQDLAREG